MKTRELKFCRTIQLGLAFLCASFAAHAETLTFDDLSPGSETLAIPNGYGGLRWNNFGVYCGSCRSFNEGYRAGTTSPTNVAFNIYGDPASISSSNTFNLRSAYLTMALNLDTPLDVRVQGYHGTTALYSNTYRVTRFAPTLVNFDFTGVDRVTFTSIPSQQFAMDDLVVTFGSACDFVITPGGRLHGGGAETGSVAVAVQEGCGWSAATTNDWITLLSPATNSGAGSVSYAVAANPVGMPRQGRITIAGQSFSVRQAAAPIAPVLVGPIEVSSVGHFFSSEPAFPDPGFGGGSFVSDFLIDQGQTTGGGATLPSTSINWDTNSEFSIKVSAPAGQKFAVRAPAGTQVAFAGFLWWESTRGGLSPAGSVSVSFDGLEGSPPDFSGSDSVLSSSHGYFGIMDLEGAPATNEFSFTAITLTGSVVPQYTGHGTENYIPHHESSMSLWYTTSDSTDPGPFVSLVPVSPAPALRVASVSATSGSTLAIQGSVNKTNVVEYSEDLVHWTPLSTNLAPCTINDPAGATSPRRFYRIVEVR